MNIKYITDSIKRIFELITLIWKDKPFGLIIWILLVLIGSTFPAIQIWLQKKGIDAISLTVANKNNWKIACLFIILLYACYIFSTFLAEIQNFLFVKISDTINYKLKYKVLKKIKNIPLENFEDSKFYNKIEMADIATTKNSIQVVNNLFMIIQNIISIIALLGILANVSWYLPITLLASSLPGIILLFIAKSGRYKMMVNTANCVREMKYTNSILLGKKYLREIHTTNIFNFLIKKWDELCIKSMLLKFNQTAKESKSRIIGVLVVQIVSMAVAIILIIRIKEGYLTFGDYVSLLGAVSVVQSMIGNIGSNIGNIFEVSLYNNSLFDFLKIYENDENIRKIPFPMGELDKIEIKGVSFSYPNSETEILKNVSFTINRGEKIAIVGENGAGKTTLVNCILGLFCPNEGNIFFGNIDVSKIDKVSLSENVATIFQDFNKYEYTIRENVGFGNISKLNEDNDIFDVLDLVGLRQKIDILPSGINTRLGKQFENGQEFSGGEWQKIAIARALLKDAEIIIMDEPTSSLDPRAELEVFNCFKDLSQNKTTIMISHRLGSVKSADRIIVLKNGKIIEQGGHEQLMKLDGEYSKMYIAQSQWYQDIDV